MFNKIFIENEIAQDPRVEKILNRFPQSEKVFIDDYQHVFGKVRKPYLLKRTHLDLFLANKKGQLVKEAPPAYGLIRDPHYYFVHSYNCIYECTYCYLQGYFDSPDIVLFLNHQEILNEIEKVINQTPKNINPWFHAGEFSDSLALLHISGEYEMLYQLFKKYPQTNLELRTKSVNIKEIVKYPPLKNIYTSFSLSPEDRVREIDLKTPSLKLRLKAISELANQGYSLGLHFDPIIYDENIFLKYRDLVNELLTYIQASQISYISLGVVRFTKDVYHQVEKNYPDSSLLSQEFIKSFDNKIRYPRPMRLYILKTIRQILVDAGFSLDQVYLCMEDTYEG